MNHILSLTFNNCEYPVLEIIEKVEQTVVRYIHQESHFTLHLKNKRILFTIWDSKYRSTWSNEKVNIARKIGYKNPEKHGHYLFHGGLIKVSNYVGYYLVASRLSLRKASGDIKYLKNATNIGISDIEDPMLNIVLSTADNPIDKKNKIMFPIQFGELFFILDK